MTMTAREAMQALLDGKGVVSDQDLLYWLTEQDRLVFRRVQGFVEYDSSEMNQIVSIYGESPDYSLTFEEALKAMLDGKTVMRENSDEHAYRFRNGTFESSTEGDCFTEWESCTMFASIQKVKWKVVE